MTIKMSRKQAKIFEVALNSTSTSKVLSFVRASVTKFRKKALRRAVFVTTPNPEMLSLAKKDAQFASTLNSADLSIPDGVGLAQAESFLRESAPKNVLRFPTLLIKGIRVGLKTLLLSGADFDLKVIKGRTLFLDLIGLANKKAWKVFLLGGQEGVSKKTQEALERSYKRVKLASFEGPTLTKNGTPVSEVDRRKQKDALDRIKKLSPDLLFVAFGAPKQERWVAKNIDSIRAGVVMVVGGTFDYVSGKKTPPPSWMTKMGIEWVWRLILEPTRARRVLNAFPGFPLKVFWYKLKNK